MTLFYDVQSEIFAACFECRVVCLQVEDGVCFYEVDDWQKDVFKVEYSGVDHSALCSCVKFDRLF